MDQRELLLQELQQLPWHLKNVNYIRTAIAALQTPNVKIRCGKRTPTAYGGISVSWQHSTSTFLQSKGFYLFETGNDAPKKGVVGDYIIVYPY